MRLKIEDLKNPVVEVAEDGSIPSLGALVHVSFEPNPKFQLFTSTPTNVIYEPQANGAPKFNAPGGKEWDPSIILPEFQSWRIITAFIAIECYLADKIAYRPQIVKYLLKTLSPAKR